MGDFERCLKSIGCIGMRAGINKCEQTLTFVNIVPVADGLHVNKLAEISPNVNAIGDDLRELEGCSKMRFSGQLLWG